MTDVRFDTTEDTMNNCLTVVDSREQLTTSFGSNIVLSPVEDAEVIVRELNIQCAVNEMLIEELEKFVDIDDIMYWISEVMEDI